MLCKSNNFFACTKTDKICKRARTIILQQRLLFCENIAKETTAMLDTWAKLFDRSNMLGRSISLIAREMVGWIQDVKLAHERIARDLPALEMLNGPDSGKLLVVGWGGTYGHILSAVREIGDAVSYVHFDYINPLPANTGEVFGRFEKILVCELNSGQFADYLRAKFPGSEIKKFNKVQGQPFLVSELVSAIQKEM